MDESVLKSYLSSSSNSSNNASTTSHNSTPTTAISSPPLPSFDSSLPPTSRISVSPDLTSFLAPSNTFSTTSSTVQGGRFVSKPSFGPFSGTGGNASSTSTGTLPDRAGGKFKILGQVGVMSTINGSRVDASALLGGGGGGVRSGSSGAELLGFGRPKARRLSTVPPPASSEQKIVVIQDGEMLPPPPSAGITRSRSGGSAGGRLGAPLRREHHDKDVATPDTTIRREVFQTVRLGNSARSSKLLIESTVGGEGETEFKEEEEQVSRTEGSEYEGVGNEIGGSKRARSENYEEYSQFEEGQRRKSRRQEDEEHPSANSYGSSGYFYPAESYHNVPRSAPTHRSHSSNHAREEPRHHRSTSPPLYFRPQSPQLHPEIEEEYEDVSSTQHLSVEQDPLASISELFPGENSHLQLVEARMNRDVKSSIRDDEEEEVKDKWTDCTFEEWQKGGEELSRKFEGLMQKVVQILIRKSTRTESFEARIEAHKRALQERELSIAATSSNMTNWAGQLVGMKK